MYSHWNMLENKTVCLLQLFVICIICTQLFNKSVCLLVYIGCATAISSSKLLQKSNWSSISISSLFHELSYNSEESFSLMLKHIIRSQQGSFSFIKEHYYKNKMIEGKLFLSLCYCFCRFTLIWVFKAAINL